MSFSGFGIIGGKVGDPLFPPTEIASFSSSQLYHELDGKKIKSFNVMGDFKSKDDVDELIEWLKITRELFD